MDSYRPYNIVHLSLTGISEQTMPSGNALCYIWWQDIPLGHIWMSGDMLSIADFRGRVLHEVRPVIKYYVAQQGVPYSDGWEHPFVQGRQRELGDFLSASLQGAQLLANGSNAGPISIIICTRNRPTFLDNCIRAILDNTDQGYELIVVDNASDNNDTMDVVSRYPAVRYVPEPRKGLDIARNTGARNATHNIIAYTDDDVIVDKNWVMKLKQCFNDPTVLAVTGQVIPIALDTLPQYIFEKHWGFNKGYLPRLFDYGYFVTHSDNGVPVWDIGAGANMAFRREVFDLVGWFDERLDVGAAGCSGDSEFWYRILAERWNCSYYPQLYVYHNHRDSEKALTNQIFNYMRGQVASLFVQYERYGHAGNMKRVRKILPTYYYYKIKERLLSSRRDGVDDFSTLFTEIKGCIAGWLFYRSVRRPKPDVAENQSYAPVAFTPVTGIPLVSVIITSYNYARYLEQCIDSVLAQTYTNIEIVVVDDGSTDNTGEVLKKYSNITSIVTPRVGASAARNIGVNLSRGDLIVFLDADDYLYPDAIAINHKCLKDHPECAFVSGAFNKVNEAGELLPADIDPKQISDNKNYVELLKGNYIGMLGNVLYRRALFFAFHFDTSLLNCEDYDLNLRISQHYAAYTHTTPIIGYRQHGANKSRNTKRMYTTVKKILMHHYLQAKKQNIKDAIKEGLSNWKGYYKSRNSMSQR